MSRKIVLDEKMRKQLKLKIGKQLPLRIKEEVKRELLSRFEVYNLTEWKEKFNDIEIKSIK